MHFILTKSRWVARNPNGFNSAIATEFVLKVTLNIRKKQIKKKKNSLNISRRLKIKRKKKEKG